MEKDSKIYIAGNIGMVGSAIHRNLVKKGYANFVFRTIDELDLTRQQDVSDFFEHERPEYVILAAAKVGGIMANNTYRAQFIYENLQIQNNIIHQSYLSGVNKLLFLGSSCIYPKDCPQPIKEEYLLTGLLEQTNEPYAIAKIAGIKMCENYFRQYGCNFISVMPTNLYGSNDNYNLASSHVLPAIIRKMHLAHCLENNNWEAIRRDLDTRPIEDTNGKATDEQILQLLNKYGINYSEFRIQNSESRIQGTEAFVIGHSPLITLSLWGSGKVYREFMHVDDMAEACVKIMEEVSAENLAGQNGSNIATFLNIGTGVDQTIAEISSLVRSIVGFTGEIRWDHTRPDGTLKKLLDVSKLRSLGITSFLSLEDGIRSVYSDYIHNGSK